MTLLRLVETQLLWAVLEVGRVALRRDTSLVGLLDKEVPTLLLTEVNGILCRVKLHRKRLLVVSRRGPAHERALPAARALENVKVHAPVLGTSLARRRG